MCFDSCGECIRRENELVAMRNEMAALREQLNELMADRCSRSAAVPSAVTPVRLAKGGIGWEVVRRGPKRGSPPTPTPSVTVRNRFETLTEEPVEVVEPVADGVVSKRVLIVGDSNVKRFDRWVVPRGVPRERVSFVSLPGAGVDDVKDRVAQMVKSERSDEVLVVLNVGVNDAARTGSEVLLQKVVDLAATTKACGPGVHVRVCTIPERRDKGDLVQSRIMGVNGRLVGRCEEIGVGVLDWRPSVSHFGEKWSTDGVHFSRPASRVVGHTIAVAVRDFLG